MKSYWCLFTAAITFLAASANCQAALSLPEAIEQALEHAPDPKVLFEQKEALSSQSKAALAPVSPSFNYTTGNIDTPNGAVDQVYTLNQSFGFPGKGLVQSEALSLRSQATELSQEQKTNEIRALAKTRYYDVWLWNRQLSINQEKHGAYEKILALAKKRLVRNTSTEVEYLSAQVALHGLDNDRSDLEAGKETSVAKLNLLLGNDPEEPLEIKSPPRPSFPFRPDVAEFRTKALQTNPELQAALTQTRAAERFVTGAKMSVLPDFTLSGAIDSENDKQAGIQLTFPLWYPFSQSHEIDAARASELAQELQTQTLRRSVLEGLESQISILKSLSRKIANYQEDMIPLSKTAFDKALANYRFGKVSYSVLVMAADAWTSALMQNEILLNQYAHEHAQLELTLGQVSSRE